MRQRTSIDKEHQTVLLRKSPRLHPKIQQNSEDPKTPDIEPRANRATNPQFSPLSSHRPKPSNKQQKEVSRKAKEKCAGSNSSTGLRKSSRLTCGTEVSKTNASIISSNSSLGSRRVTRSSCQSQPAKSSLEVATEGGDNRGGNVDLEEKKRGVKRKKSHGKDGHVIAKGWTKEQELALERAYFAAKATPHFWKKVAKMVPGKSSQECFDRIHLDHATPPQPRPRVRTKKTVSSLMSPPSASKLLQPADAKPKRHVSQKAVREILNKQYMVKRDSKGIDLFSLLEESTTTTTTTQDLPNGGANLVTPELKLGHLSNFSQQSNLKGANLFSPPVLKPIKNKALHDRYIDQLHCRDAKRKAAYLRTLKLNQTKKEEHQRVNKTAAVQAAKNALIFDARDAIKQFQNSQTNPFQNIFCGREEEEEEDIGDDCGCNGDDD
ncbi:unnamed protein product [Cuscuta campestris]|uniref:Myb-like domain-containing protein n=1 Tax=Cuscuta campestris TaxID=132261 RepID=A0A484LG00_9ASTE|nr:unnamed protein product [Cuscuta campestris]